MPLSAASVEETASWRDYLALCKLKVVALLVFTAVVGMFLATPGMVPFDVLVFGTLGIGLGAASGAAFNHVVDQRIDSIMARTRARPLPRGRLDSTLAVLFAAVLCILSMIVLVAGVNVLTAGLTLASMVGYSVIYTMYLKRATPQNIVIGGAAGATPPVLVPGLELPLSRRAFGGGLPAKVTAAGADGDRYRRAQGSVHLLDATTSRCRGPYLCLRTAARTSCLSELGDAIHELRQRNHRPSRRLANRWHHGIEPSHGEAIAGSDSSLRPSPAYRQARGGRLFAG